MGFGKREMFVVASACFLAKHTPWSWGSCNCFGHFLFHVTYYDTATGFIINVCPSSPSKILKAAPSLEFLQWFLFS